MANDEWWDERHAGDGGHVEKMLPQNVEAEAGVLGSLLIDPEAIAQVYLAGLRGHHFYNEAHRTIFNAMRELWDDHQPADLITVCDELERRGKMEEVGGVSYVSSLANQVPTSRNAVHYAGIVIRCAFLRALINFAGDTAGIAYSDPDADAAYSLILAKLLKVGEQYAAGSGYFIDVADVMDALHEETMRRVDGGVAGILIPTGMPQLDKIAIGYEPGELHTFCARPGGLKSTLAIYMARNMADHLIRTNTDGCVGYVSLEMPNLQQARRLIAAHAGLNTLSIRSGFRDPDDLSGDPSDEDVERFTTGVATFSSTYRNRIKLCDRALNLSELQVAVAEAVATSGMRVVFVDQADLFDEEGRRQEGDTALVAAVCKQLKRMTQRLGITVVLLAQLGRQVEGQVDHRAQRHMAKNSGRIEQDSSGLYFIHYPYLWQSHRTGPEDETFRSYFDVTVVKLREGRPGKRFPMWIDAASSHVAPWPATEPLPDLGEEPVKDGEGGESVEWVGVPHLGGSSQPLPPSRPPSPSARPAPRRDRRGEQQSARDSLRDWPDWRQQHDEDRVVDADPFVGEQDGFGNDHGEE